MMTVIATSIDMAYKIQTTSYKLVDRLLLGSNKSGATGEPSPIMIEEKYF